MKATLNTNDEIVQAVIKTLGENGKWMTANEIIHYGSSHGLLEAKNAPRQAMAHPVYRVLTGMMRKDEIGINGLERRIRTSGDESGSYEYAYKGLYDGTKILVNGEIKTPARGSIVEIGGKKYSQDWLDKHPGKEAELRSMIEMNKTPMDKAMENYAKSI